MNQLFLSDLDLDRLTEIKYIIFTTYTEQGCRIC